MGLVLIDMVEFGLPESERGRAALGDLVHIGEDPRNAFGEREFLDEWGPTVHLRDSARWNGVEIRLPAAWRNAPLHLEINAKTYRTGAMAAAPGPTYFYLQQEDRSWELGSATIPFDEQWHTLRLRTPAAERGGERLFLVIDDQSSFVDKERFYGRAYGSLAVYAPEEAAAEAASPPVLTEKRPDVALVICPVWDNIMPPIGLGAISSFLRAHGQEASIFDFNIEAYRAAPADKRFVWHGTSAPQWNEQPFVSMVLQLIEPGLQEVAERIARQAPNFIGFSLATVNAPVTLRLAEVLRRRLPDAKLIFGGPGIPFFEPHQFGGAWDFLVLGAGEHPMLHIVKGRRGRMSGLIERRKGEVARRFTERARILDINQMPLLDFRGFDLSLYTTPWRVPVLTSRGCINQCKYCFDHIYYGPFSALTGEYAYRQLVHLNRLHGRRMFEFSDLLCNGDLTFLADMCERLAAGGHDFMWGSFAVIRSDMTPDLFRLMKRAGCSYMHYGFESGSAEMLKRMGRDYTPEEARQVLADTKAAGIRTQINLMVGFPGETDRTIDESIAFIRDNASIIDVVDTVNPVYLMALSDLYTERDDYGISLPDTLPDTWASGDIDFERREQWVLRTIEGLQDAGVKSNLGISRSFQCRMYD